MLINVDTNEFLTFDQPRPTLINLRSTSINLKLGQGVNSVVPRQFSLELRYQYAESHLYEVFPGQFSHNHASLFSSTLQCHDFVEPEKCNHIVMKMFVVQVGLVLMLPYAYLLRMLRIISFSLVFMFFLSELRPPQKPFSFWNTAAAAQGVDMNISGASQNFGTRICILKLCDRYNFTLVRMVLRLLMYRTNTKFVIITHRDKEIDISLRASLN